MQRLTRRSLLRSSAGLLSGAVLARPFIANAAATTATVWWVQGFAQEEDIAFKKMVADYEKESGNTIDYSIVPYAPLRQKIVSAITSGTVPDVIPNNPGPIIALYAWNGKLVDVSDVVETQREEYTETALLAAHCYNNVEKKRSFYGVPYSAGVALNHIWRPLVEKAGYQMSDIPKTWDAYYDFFKPVQKKLRAQGMRSVYAFGFQLTTNGFDPNSTWAYFLIAHGGHGIVTRDGRLHLDDPKVKEAAIKALTYLTSAYKEGYVPPGAINWNDADDNNAFHSKQTIMDLDGSISTEVAVIADQQAYHDIVTQGLALSNEGKPVSAMEGANCALIPQGAKNVAVAKDFLKYWIQPKVVDELLKVGLGRNLPVMPSLAKSDPFWLDPKDPHVVAHVRQGLLGPSVPNFWVFNPAYAEVEFTQIWGKAEADVMHGGMTPQAALDKAFKQIEEIFAKYPIAQS